MEICEWYILGYFLREEKEIVEIISLVKQSSFVIKMRSKAIIVARRREMSLVFKTVCKK